VWRHKLTRDGLLFLIGAGAFLHEVAIHVGPERPTLILGALALMGLPIWLRADEDRHNSKEQ
jgi:hypothetical protein